MFRKMRRKAKEIGLEEIEQLLLNSRRGVLAVNGDDDYPYAVPVNYLYDSNRKKIYFHGACAGYKAEAIRACDKVCFTVYGNEEIKGEVWAPYVKSAVIFGRCHFFEKNSAAIEILRQLASKYYPDEKLIDEEIAKSGKAVQLFEIQIEHLSGKEIQER